MQPEQKPINTQNQNPNSNPIGSFISILIVFIAISLALYKAIQFYEASKQHTLYQTIATHYMQLECAKNCAAYGVTQSSLLGPQTDNQVCCGSNGALHDLYSWHSNHPDVTLKVRVAQESYSAPITVDPSWVGTPLRNSHNNPPTRLIRDDIEKVLHQHESLFRNAYQHALITTPSMHGSRIDISMLIAPDGHVSDVSIVASDLNSPDLKENLLQIFRNLRFSTGNYIPVKYSYIISFNQ